MVWPEIRHSIALAMSIVRLTQSRLGFRLMWGGGRQTKRTIVDEIDLIYMFFLPNLVKAAELKGTGDATTIEEAFLMSVLATPTSLLETSCYVGEVVD